MSDYTIIFDIKTQQYLRVNTDDFKKFRDGVLNEISADIVYKEDK